MRRINVQAGRVTVCVRDRKNMAGTDAMLKRLGVPPDAVKAKATGKSGVEKGSKKATKNVKAVVGEDRATTVEAVAKEKGNAGGEKGVDKGAEKVDSKLK
jgi:hypothetical protein